ncbi:uncharacterized protein B0H18DRAFT_62190 [Fomitopsis serialis]|uniref:uncharacterized protein n=1 Tax=Fomitopsis serialis TaxID=139415 RepID=UPI00200722F3|nr:uncharacterized protein B0H18DRAFT_62190 [Neoantrodia serialis]KAH9916679.1 hypothetical protein B0H18DRAFT_62190 [Neoantrodia serialis]
MGQQRGRFLSISLRDSVYGYKGRSKWTVRNSPQSRTISQTDRDGAGHSSLSSRGAETTESLRSRRRSGTQPTREVTGGGAGAQVGGMMVLDPAVPSAGGDSERVTRCWPANARSGAAQRGKASSTRGRCCYRKSAGAQSRTVSRNESRWHARAIVLREAGTMFRTVYEPATCVAGDVLGPHPSPDRHWLAIKPAAPSRERDSTPRVSQSRQLVTHHTSSFEPTSTRRCFDVPSVNQYGCARTVSLACPWLAIESAVPSHDRDRRGDRAIFLAVPSRVSSHWYHTSRARPRSGTQSSQGRREVDDGSGKEVDGTGYQKSPYRGLEVMPYQVSELTMKRVPCCWPGDVRRQQSNGARSQARDSALIQKVGGFGGGSVVP